jgi:hypothetical protein
MAFLDDTFDASTVDPAQPRGEPLPPGKYVAQIIESEIVDTQKGGRMLKLTIEVLEGEHQRRRLWDQLNIVNANPKAQEIAHRTLSAICHAVNKMQVRDSEELHGRALLVTVKVEPDSRDAHLPVEERRYRNIVGGYEPVSGPAPKAAPPARQAPAQAAPPPAAKPASSTPPWRRSA